MELTEEQLLEIVGIHAVTPVFGGGDERRRHPRAEFGSRGMIYPLLPGAEGSPVLVRDISLSGIGLLVERELAVGDEFVVGLTTVKEKHKFIHCMTQRCERGGMGEFNFILGATFELMLDEWEANQPKREPFEWPTERTEGAWKNDGFWYRFAGFMKSRLLDRSSSKIHKRLKKNKKAATAESVKVEPKPMPLNPVLPLEPIVPVVPVITGPSKLFARGHAKLQAAEVVKPVEVVPQLTVEAETHHETPASDPHLDIAQVTPEIPLIVTAPIEAPAAVELPKVESPKRQGVPMEPVAPVAQVVESALPAEPIVTPAPVAPVALPVQAVKPEPSADIPMPQAVVISGPVGDPNCPTEPAPSPEVEMKPKKELSLPRYPDALRRVRSRVRRR